MSDNTDLGDRMKRYEEAAGSVLLRRTPVIVRVDGKAFHTLTKRISPDIDPTTDTHFSQKFHNVMLNVAKYCITNIQNSVLAYTQSDEISFLLKDWTRFETGQWFDGKVQKISSVTAAMAAVSFNHFWENEFNQTLSEQQLALFDARCYNVPMDDVTNYFLWRQRDSMRNSVNFIARKFCSHKELQNMNGSQIKSHLWEKCGVAWDKYPLWEQRGSCVNSKGVIDDNIPVFSENRDYIQSLLEPEEQ